MPDAMALPPSGPSLLSGREPPEREVAAGVRVDAVPSRVRGGVLGARDRHTPRVGRVNEPHVLAQRADAQVTPATRAADDGAREEPAVVAVAVAVIGAAAVASRGVVAAARAVVVVRAGSPER